MALSKLERPWLMAFLAYEMGTDLHEEDDGDDEDLPQKHDPSSKALPRLPIYHPAFKLVEQAVPVMIRVFHESIDKHGYRDSQIKHILEQVKPKLKISYGQALRLRMVGDTGAGKSAALNLILGIPNLTVEVCTLTPTAGQSITN